jgi:hypothetical protein
MYGERKREFLKRLRDDYKIYSRDINKIIERLSNGDSSEEIAREYRLDDVDVERIINQFEYNEPDDEPEYMGRDDT